MTAMEADRCGSPPACLSGTGRAPKRRLPASWLWIAALLAAGQSAGSAAAADFPPIERRLPPPGEPVPDAIREPLERRVHELRGRLAIAVDHPRLPDAEIYLKAVELALEFGEFYKIPADLEKAERALDTAKRRIDAILSAGTPGAPWDSERGLVVLGHRSTIDGSAQPFGLEIPESLNLDRPVPLYVWLHGRGDTQTDLHFIAERESKRGQFAGRLDDGITLHPFGRQCIGYKSAGEIDVLEAIDAVVARYPIDRDRIALMGFSMGGAGAWHLGAHHADRFAAVHAGAGFVDVARYQKLKPESFPPPWEQALWGLYDVPASARNLLNVPVIAYSGSDDKQKDAADFMTEVLATHGLALPHVIGQGMGHKYDDAGMDAVAEFIRDALARGRDPLPDTIHLQTRTLRYPRMHWIEVTALIRHWTDSRIDAVLDPGRRRLEISTANVSAFSIHRALPQDAAVVIDGAEVALGPGSEEPIHFARPEPEGGEDSAIANSHWVRVAAPPDGLRKAPGLQGPIDDAFVAPFLVVPPDGTAAHPAVDAWVRFELDHLRSRWRALFRGSLPEKPAALVTADDLARHHLVLFGDPSSNPILARMLDRLPIEWTAETLTMGEASAPSGTHVPLLVYPNPDRPDRYVVLNSGPTFREAHDRTNSLQNPKLPDWALLDIASRPPDAESAGNVRAAGFFSESWEFLP